MNAPSLRRKVSVVAPVWNEASLVEELHRRVVEALDTVQHRFDVDVEFVIGDDGSTDGTNQILVRLSASDPRLRVVRLSRNFGHQACLTAAMSHANGDFVILMDGDLEDPPELIPEICQSLLTDSLDVVLCVRTSRRDSWIRTGLFRIFHVSIGFLSNHLVPQNVGTFCGLSRRAADAILALGETNRFLPGIRAWIGYPSKSIFYQRQARFSGTPRQTFRRLTRYAFDAIFGFSYKPLRMSVYIGVFSWILSVVYALVLVAARLLSINVVSGFTTTTVLILFFGGLTLMSLGILGEYVGRIYDEVKKRPQFFVDDVISHGCSQMRIQATHGYRDNSGGG